MRYFNIGLFIILGLILAGCARIDHYANPRDYHNSQSIPSLKVPNDLSSKKLVDYYSVPNLRYPATRSSASIIPPGSTLSKK